MPALNIKNFLSVRTALKPAAVRYARHPHLMLLVLLVGIFAIGSWIFWMYALRPIKVLPRSSNDLSSESLPTAALDDALEILQGRESAYRNPPSFADFPDPFH